MSVRKTLIVLTFLVLGMPIAIFAYQANQVPVETTSQIQRYQVVEGTVQVTVDAVGSVAPAETVHLSFMSTGRLIDLPFVVGDYVQAGDILAIQDDANSLLSLDQATLGVALAELQRDIVLEGASETEITIAEANLQSAQSAALAIQNAVNSNDITTAQLAYEQALAAVSAAQEARNFASGDQAPEYYSLLDAQIGQATFNAEIARLQLESLQAGSPSELNVAYARITQAQAELARIQAGPSQTDLDRAETQVQQAQLQVDTANVNYERTRLIAPFDGLVSAQNGELGMLVPTGMTIIELMNVDPLRLTVQIDELDVRLLREGQTAFIEVDALAGQQLEAVVERIAFVPNMTSAIVTYDVQLRLEETDPRVLVGMTADASIIIERREGVLVVPNQYIRIDRTRNNQAYVNLVQSDGTLLEVPITLGLQGRDSSQVISGIQENDIIGVNLAGDTISGLFGG